MWLDNQKQEKLAINKKFKDTEATQDAEMIRQANAARHQMAYEKNYRQNLEKAIQNYNQHLVYT